MNILFICTENVCRSPMAEALANDVLTKNKRVAAAFSRGIYARNSQPATSHAISAVKKYGLNLSNHMSTRVTAEDIHKADIILTMTRGHKEHILLIYPEVRSRVYTLKEYSGNKEFDYDVADPYGYGLEVYETCAEEIKEYVEIAIKKLLDRWEAL